MDDKSLLIEIGKRIVKIRETKGLKQIELATLMEIEDSSLRRIEKGRVNSSVLMLNKVAKALDVDLVELIDVNKSAD